MTQAAASEPAPFPAGWQVTWDPSTRSIDGGRILIGGAPLRLVRLTETGAAVAAGLARGEAVGADGGARRLARRLVDAGMCHPRPPRSVCGSAGRVTIVIPVLDRSAGLEHTLRSLQVTGPAEAAAAETGPAAGPDVIVVDDGSGPHEAATISAAAQRFGARLVRREVTGGPAAARNTGWRAASTELIAFLDADCVAGPGWLGPLVAHFGDPAVGAAAPRVIAFAPPGTPDLLARYERIRSPLDRGPLQAPVRPRGRVPFVPSAALVVARDALAALGGFDEAMKVGEDVDLVWRLLDAGRSVRYEPAVEVGHPCRSSWAAAIRQRVTYGSSAAGLHDRHAGAVSPLTVSGWSLASWGLAAAGAPAAGIATAAATTAMLPARLPEMGHPWRESVRIAGAGHVWAGRAIADAMRRAWWPALVLTSVPSRRVRRATIAAATLPLAIEWATDRPPLDAVRWGALRLADDLSYGAGLWWGCLRARRFGALAPDLTNWPGPGARLNLIRFGNVSDHDHDGSRRHPGPGRRPRR